MRIKHFTYMETDCGVDRYSFRLSLCDGNFEFFMQAKFYPKNVVVLLEPDEMHLSQSYKENVIALLKLQYMRAN